MGTLPESHLRIILTALEDGAELFTRAREAARLLLLSKIGPYNEADCAALIAVLREGPEVFDRMDKAIGKL